jgi:hypothetical protein
VSGTKIVKREFISVIATPDKHFSVTASGMKPIDRHDPAALSVALQIVDVVKPDIYIDLGDLGHFPYLSGFSVKKDLSNRVVTIDGKTASASLKLDHEIINHWHDLVRKACRRDTEMVQLEGNHDELLRICSHMEKYAAVADQDCWNAQKAWHLEQRRIKWIPYQRYGDTGKNYYDVGKLRFLHGQYALEQHINKHNKFWPGQNLVYGHMHTVEKKMFPHEKFCISVQTIGCLCTKYASYHRGRNNAWAQGLLEVKVFSDGSFLDNFIHILNGKAMYGGRVYHAKPIKGIS